MFINIIYKDSPELSSSNFRRIKSDSTIDTSTEKILLVNPNCYVRILLEYIRSRCNLGIYTHFDLCDETGVPKGLFNLPTYAYATELFEHKKTYYLIVIKQEEKRLSIFPQLNRENRLYLELQTKVKKFLQTGYASTTDVSKSDSKIRVAPPKTTAVRRTSSKNTPSTPGTVIKK